MNTETPLIKPERLRFNDVVGIVAPASAPPDPESIDRHAAALAKLGFRPKLSANIRRRLGFLAGTDQERASDIMAMFADPEVKAIFCLRGGYGSARLLPLLDYQFIRKYPKILIGFSDITSLHCAFLIHAGLVSFHGPTLNTELTDNLPPTVMLQSLYRTVMNAEASGSICAGYSQEAISIVNPGIATGRLVGGNLSVFCSLVGTPYQPGVQDHIFFFEDIGEDPYRLDRMLTQLLNAGLLQQAAGIAIGTNHNCVDRRIVPAGEYRQTMMDVFTERLKPLDIPVVAGLPFGHTPANTTLPVGISATLDGNNGDLIITESAVT